MSSINFLERIIFDYGPDVIIAISVLEIGEYNNSKTQKIIRSLSPQKYTTITFVRGYREHKCI